MIDVPFFSLLFNFGISVRGFTLARLRSKIISDGFSSPGMLHFSIRSFVGLPANSTFTLSLRTPFSLDLRHEEEILDKTDKDA